MEAWRQHRRLTKDATRLARDVHTPPARGLGNDQDPQRSDKVLVAFDAGDHQSPREWPMRWKLFYISIIWCLVFVTGWSSAADSTAHETADIALHVSEVSESLATSNYLFGVAIGAVFAGPCSETIGRLPTYLSTFAVYMIWVMASALTPNFGAQIVFRFFAGLFASASMSIYGGSMADMLEAKDRALIWPFFALSPLLGPTVAPVASGWITQDLGWRWVDWITLIISGAAFVLAVLCLPETFSPILLSSKAAALRKTTSNDRYTSEFDESARLPQKLLSNLRRSGYFITGELTTILFGLYLTVIYLLVFGFLEGFDYVFTDTYGFDVGNRYSAFGAIAFGMVVGLPYTLLFNHFSGSSKPNIDPPPEQKLRPTLLAAPLLAGSLFWLGWTNRTSISFWSDLSACCVFGFAIMALFTATYHYLLDSYGTNAASAMAAITFMRYMASGGMVLATEPMYEALGVQWSMTLLGCVAALLAPVPWVFWWYGDKIRARSKWAFSQDEAMSE